MHASVYTVWQQFARLVKQVVPTLHGHRSKTLAWLVLGIMLAKSVASTQIAEVLRGVRGTQASSQERTFSRFLANAAIDPHKLWQSFLPVLLADWAKQPEVTFVVDTTPLGDWAIIVSFGILHHSRVWPLGWRVMPAEKAWEERQYALIAQFIKSVRPHLGQAQCRLLADSGISREKLVQLCEEAGWHYLLRIELDKGYYASETDAQGQPLWQPRKHDLDGTRAVLARARLALENASASDLVDGHLAGRPRRPAGGHFRRRGRTALSLSLSWAHARGSHFPG